MPKHAKHAAPSLRSRLSQSVPENKKLKRQQEWDDTRKPAWVAYLSIFCVIGLMITVLALSQSDRMSKPQNINGDQLGAYGVAREDYQRHANDALNQMQGDEPRWALVSLNNNMNAQELADVFVDTELRVSTLLLGPIQVPMPEPASGQRRIDVFNRTVENLSRASGIRVEDIRFEGVLVYGVPEQLRALASHEGVFCVEPAHPEAVWGRIGIQPITPMEQGAPAEGEQPAPESEQAPAPAAEPAPAPGPEMPAAPAPEPAPEPATAPEPAPAPAPAEAPQP